MATCSSFQKKTLNLEDDTKKKSRISNLTKWKKLRTSRKKSVEFALFYSFLFSSYRIGCFLWVILFFYFSKPPFFLWKFFFCQPISLFSFLQIFNPFEEFSSFCFPLIISICLSCTQSVLSLFSLNPLSSLFCLFLFTILSLSVSFSPLNVSHSTLKFFSYSRTLFLYSSYLLPRVCQPFQTKRFGRRTNDRLLGSSIKRDEAVCGWFISSFAVFFRSARGIPWDQVKKWTTMEHWSSSIWRIFSSY